MYVEREVFIELGKEMGLDIAPRTLREWSRRGILPKAVLLKVGSKHKACYDIGLLNRIKVIKDSHQTLEQIAHKITEMERAPVIEELEFVEAGTGKKHKFQISKVKHFFDPSGKVYLFKQIRQGGFLIQPV